MRGDGSARAQSDGQAPDWLAILDQLMAGDRVAFLQFNRLVTGFLAQLRAYDFRDEWDDLRQEVLISVVGNARAGRLRDPKAFVGYVKIITRNKFVDRLKRQLRHSEKDTLAWDDETARAAAVADDAAAAGGDVWSEVRTLSDEEQRILTGLYVEGRTYQEVSDATGIPLGTLKRRLRGSLAALRERLSEPGGPQGGGAAAQRAPSGERSRRGE
jgi:RNA polymerase sigma-70 factor (ECF subfamily)